MDFRPSPELSAGYVFSVTFICLFIAALALLVYPVVFNLYCHPCAKFPGPFVASVSNIYLVHKIVSVPTYGPELHRKYGPIVRIAPNLLSFSDPELLPFIYHRHADKSAFYTSWLFGDTVAMFQSLGHADHAAKKKAVSACCSMKAILAQESKFDARVDELCSQIAKYSAAKHQPIDFSEYLRWFLSDTWHELAYGEPLGWVAQLKDVDGLLGSLQGLYGLSAAAALMPWLAQWLRLPFLRKWLWSHTQTFKCLRALTSHFDDMYDRRQELPVSKRSGLFFERLRQTQKSPESSPDFRFSQEDIKAETVTFTAATLDGVSAFIAPFIDNMVRNPNIASRIRAEIDAADRNGILSRPVARYEEIARLPYFAACVRETLRRDGPAVTILPRVVSEPGYSLYGGRVFIPPGVEIGASPYIIHRNEDVFGPNATEFLPQRFLEGGADPQRVKRMERLSMWWGYGDRECAGKNYATVEMQKLCVELLRRFEFDVPEISEKHFKHVKGAVGIFSDQKLIFKERQMLDLK